MDKKIELFIEKNTCVCFNIRKISRLITQIYDEAFRATGFKATQVGVLFSVCELYPITISELAIAMSSDRTTISRNLKPLEHKGLITLKSGSDKRQRNIVITEEGRSVVNEIFPLWEKCQQELFTAIGQKKLKNVLNELCEISSVLQHK